MPDCAALVPPFLLQPAEGTDPEAKKLPDGHDDAQPWMEAWLGDEAQIEKQNDKAPAVDHIYRTCLDMHRKELQRAKRGFLGRIFGDNEPRWMGVRLDPRRYAPG